MLTEYLKLFEMPVGEIRVLLLERLLRLIPQGTTSRVDMPVLGLGRDLRENLAVLVEQQQRVLDWALEQQS
jgi:hypothetical protein